VPDPPVPASVVDRLRAAGCVFAEEEAAILAAAAADPDELAAMVTRRAGGQPLEYVVGWAGFCGLRIAVEPGVFVPRRRTEFLVREAATRAAGGCTVVDVCCGSGAIGAALARMVAVHRVYGIDVEPVAVRCAAGNLAPVGGRALLGDLLGPLPADLRGRVDLVVANVPYVPSVEVGLLPPEARLHEPRAALDGGGDGLDVLRRLARAAPDWLAPGGYLLVEAADGQAARAAAEFGRAGLAPEVARCAELGATVVVGRRAPAGILG
jgi:release factor glutamine methyltransferase